MRTAALVVGILALCASGCRERHLIRGYGDSYKAFAAQAVTQEKPSEAVVGLDSQDAAITADNYRAGLVPEGKDVKAEPTVLVAPPTRERREQLAPSVPKE